MSRLSFPTRSNTQTLMTAWCVYSLSVLLKVDSSMCKCARMQIPMRSEPSWGLSHAKSILNMLPQHVIAAPPTCSVWIACFTPPLPGPLSMRNLNKPVPFTSNSIHHLLFITSNQQRGKVTRFYPLFLLNQESASGQVNPVDIVDVAYFSSLVYAHTSWWLHC